MATNTFDRKIEITDMDSLKKLLNIMSEDVTEPISEPAFSYHSKERSEQLLDQWLLHLKH